MVTVCGLRKEIHQFSTERCALTAESSFWEYFELWLERSEHTVSVQYSINVVSSSKDFVFNVKFVICI